MFPAADEHIVGLGDMGGIAVDTFVIGVSR